MPEDGLNWLPGDQLLKPDELARLMRIAVTRLGVTSVRFTGGEPLLARHLEEVVAAAAGLTPRPEISLTTNGVGLARRAAALAAAGLDRVNVSLDSVNAAHFAAITRRDRLDDVLAGLAAAEAAGLAPVKVNAVLDPATGREDVVELLRYCLQHGYQLRVIEQMPLDAGHQWRRGAALSADDVLAALRPHFRLEPDPAPRGSAPAELWLVDTGPDTPGGKVGIIASVSHAFCSTCDRTRLTADGQIRSCLFSTRGDRPSRPASRWRRRRRHRGGLARRDVGQARRPRHQRTGVHPARPSDERHRWLRLPPRRSPEAPEMEVTVRYFAAAQAAAATESETLDVATGHYGGGVG